MGNSSGTQVMITRQEVAKNLGISTRTVRRWEQKGWLSSFKIGNIVRYRKTEVDKLVESLMADLRP